MLKLLVTDLDGTLLKIGNELSAGISDENREALEAFVKAGGHVAIASSRGADAQTMISGLLGIPVAAIGMNGFVVLDEEGEKISEHWMRFSDFAQLADFIKEHRINGSLITRGEDGGAYGFGGEQDYPQRLTLGSPVIRQNWRLEFADFAYRSGRCSKISLFVEPAQHHEASRLLHQAFDGRFEIAASDADMLDVSPIGINKGSGILELAKAMGIRREEIAVVGDNENDLSMFKVIPLSYCMDHAASTIQSQASCSVAAVAEALARAQQAAK
ncbi:HAD-IIB family hydrolase [Holdemania massiliensis]|uniref:HAD-IIB family hydrolase n=1 Tax=Holdemania massiliensis TaxID=1468449 RepID=UPI002675CDCE|nr:HAD-IIB family hydrolase [Holdemania massiliensis]